MSNNKSHSLRAPRGLALAGVVPGRAWGRWAVRRWRAWWAAAAAVLARAEQHITANFRVPPGGG